MDLQEEVERRYPIGTKFISPYSKYKFIVKDYYDNGNREDLRVKSHSNNVPYVYWKGKWAEIISVPIDYEIY